MNVSPPAITGAVGNSPVVTEVLTMEQALELLMSHARPIGGTETVPTADALGRVLAQPVASGIDVPGWDNSAMDGYAVRSEDLAGGRATLRLVGELRAGQPAGDTSPADGGRRARREIRFECRRPSSASVPASLDGVERRHDVRHAPLAVAIEDGNEDDAFAHSKLIIMWGWKTMPKERAIPIPIHMPGVKNPSGPGRVRRSGLS